MAAVSVDGLTFSYSRKESNLENVNLLVPRGTIYGLLGPSGCCKTTLLRCIVGRLKPKTGTVTVFGYRPGTKECGIPGPNIGYMPQELSLITQFTVRETLEYYAGFVRQSDLPNNSLDERIEFLLKLLDISEFENCYTDRLSGGQKRRVSLAVSMINDPPLLVLDEPTVGVDPIVRDAIWSYLVNQSKNGLTVIVTTHYIEEAGSADKVGFMRQGRILAEGNPNVLMHQHCVTSMERLFLKLSQRDDIRVRASEFSRDLLLQMSNNDHMADLQFNGASYSNGSVNFVNSQGGNKKSNLMLMANEKYKNIDHDLIVSNGGSVDTVPGVGDSVNNNNNGTNHHNHTHHHHSHNHHHHHHHPQNAHPHPPAHPHANNNNNNNNNNNYTNNNNNSPCYYKVNMSNETTPGNNQLLQPNTSIESTNYTTVSKSKASRTYSVHGQNRSVNSYQRIGVLCRKHRIRLFRRVSELVITLLLPALEVALFCLCMGRDPTSVQMAVCNQESPPFLSKLFLQSIDSDFIALKYFNTPVEAIDSVRNAETYSAIILAKNFSSILKHFGTGSVTERIQTIAMVNKGLETTTMMPFTPGEMLALGKPNTDSANLTTVANVTKSYHPDRMKRTTTTTTTLEPKAIELESEVDDNSVIKIYYDGSNALHVNIIRREVFSALFRFVDTASKTFGGDISGYQLPIKFEKPIYGSEKTDMVEFVGPGLMVFIVFFATMSITSMAFLSERREGTLERSLIVGMTPTEFIISQIINITFLLIVQITLTVVMGFWIFDFPMKGSYVLAVAMMFLQGLCGMTYGLMLSAICTNEMAALTFGAGSQLMFCFITGIFWPVDTMITLLRYISYAMPQTKPMESFRHILIRGFDFSKPAVYNGYIITVAWIIFFLVLSIVIFRLR